MTLSAVSVAAILLAFGLAATLSQAEPCPDDRTANVTVRDPAPGPSATVMIDGVLSPGEWDAAVGVESGLNGRVLVRRSESHLYVAVAFPEGTGGFVDLFVTACGDTHALHASAKLGERSAADESGDRVWWNNVGWVANTSRVDSFEQRTFLPAPVREFQIALSRFPGRLWGLRVELTATGPDGSPLHLISLPAAGEWLIDVRGPSAPQGET